MRVLFSKTTAPFRIPEEVSRTLFEAWPPSSDPSVFEKQDASLYFEGETKPSSDFCWRHRIVGRRPFCPGWTQLKTETVYTYPILTDNPKEMEKTQDATWTVVQNDVNGDMYEFRLGDSDAIRTWEELIDMLESNPMFGVETIHDDALFDIEETAEGQEYVRIHYPVYHILGDLLKIVKSANIHSKDLNNIESLHPYTRQLLEGSLQVEDM